MEFDSSSIQKTGPIVNPFVLKRQKYDLKCMLRRISGRVFGVSGQGY